MLMSESSAEKDVVPMIKLKIVTLQMIQSQTECTKCFKNNKCEIENSVWQ